MIPEYRIFETHFQPSVVAPGAQSITVQVVGSDGDPVADATVVIKDGTADIDGVEHARTDAEGNATLQVAPTLRPNQEEETLTIDIKPPAGSGFADRRGNTNVLVVRG